MTTLRQVVNVVETLYPLRYAESWDAPGLIVGEPGADVGLVAFAADPTMAVIDEAIERGADLLICHHPLLFRSVHAVSGQDVHGAIVGKLYSHHCALWVGHTNADSAWRGVGQAAATRSAWSISGLWCPSTTRGLRTPWAWVVSACWRSR